MYSLNDLINELCPNGVEYKEIKKFCDIQTGQSVSQVDILENPGEFPVINSGREPLGFISKWNTENDPIGITSRGAGVGSVTWCEGKYFRGNLNYSVTIINNNTLCTRFLYHILNYLQNDIKNLCTFVGIPALNKVNLEKLIIPVPPLPVQEEIVRILDKFTELEAELEARKKQYDYYRDYLTSETYLLHFFNSNNDVIIVKSLGECVDLVMGVSPDGSTVSDDQNGMEFHQGKTHFGDMFLKNSGQYTSQPSKTAKANSIVMSVRAPVGDTNITQNEIAIGRGLCSMNGKDGLLTKFLYYWINANIDIFKSKSNSSTFESVNTNDIKSISVSFPSEKIQKEIIRILDKFTELSFDISAGLPAEIEARRKQYEHYRGNMLNINNINVGGG